MIEIIKKGHTPKYKIECHNCSCIFKFDKRDIKYGNYTNNYINSIHCPFCHTIIELNPALSKFELREE